MLYERKKIMKKNLILIASALIFTLAVSGCGQKDSTNNTQNSNGSQMADASGSYGGSTTGDENFAQNVNMESVDGDALTSSSEKGSYEGKLGDHKVSIEDAKHFEYDGNDMVVVSIKYKNNSGQDAAFTGALDVNAYQGDAALPSAVVSGVDGIELLTMSQYVHQGEEITVQAVYALNDKSEPVTVEVSELYPTSENNTLSKTFEF